MNNNTRPPSGPKNFGNRPSGGGFGSRPAGGGAPRPSGGAPRPAGARPPYQGASAGGARPPYNSGSRDSNFRRGPRKEEIARINFQIRADSVRVIDDAGEMLGVMTVEDGVRIAKDRGVDLVEISPNANPPVCKVMDYGKYKYEHQKKQAEARKKQKAVVIKEIKLRPTTDKHDIEIKEKAMTRFLEEGDKVKVSLKFRGREMAHPEIARQQMEGILKNFEGKVKVEQFPRLEGRQMIMILGPLTAK